MKLLVTGATGLTGSLFSKHLAQSHPNLSVYCLVRPTSDRTPLENLNLSIHYLTGDTSTKETWQEIFSQHQPQTIIHIASIRHIPVILEGLQIANQTPRLIVVGTTGIYSQYNQYSAIYKETESKLTQYPGSCCILRPTMIYGSYQDKNLHKLIKFCDHYGVFPVFGSGNCLLQPVHADDLAQAILSVWQNPTIQDKYDLSGGSVVNFRELLAIVSKELNKPVYPLYIPLPLGVLSATIAEQLLGKKSPVRREQILRLQEDKAYSHQAAEEDFNFRPRTLEVGLSQEVKLLRSQGLIK